MKAFTTPTVAKIVNKIENGTKINAVSRPGIPSLDSQTFNRIIAKTLEIAEETRRILGDILYPRSSAKPTAKTGAPDKINKVSSSALRSQTIDHAMTPNDNNGISPSKLIYIAKPPTLGTKPE